LDDRSGDGLTLNVLAERVEKLRDVQSVELRIAILGLNSSAESRHHTECPEDEMTRVKDLMTRDATTLRRNEKLTLADDVMHLGRVRHLPVLDEEGKLAGIVSQRDLFRGALAQVLGYGAHARRKLLDTLQVKDVMATEVSVTTPETPIAEAARVLLERKIGCLPVVENDRLVGILTESDFVACVAREQS